MRAPTSRAGKMTVVASVLVAGLVLWEIAFRLLQVPEILLPRPLQILQALREGLAEPPSSPTSFYPHILFTMSSALMGFVLGGTAGILLGTMIAHFRAFEWLIMPYVVAFQTLPKIALAPLLVVWFGFGITSKIVIVSLLTFFPLLVNSIAGFTSVERDRLELMRSLSATYAQTFFRVRLPSALPFIFAGLDMAIVYSVIGAIVGEFVGGRRGLGVLILQTNFSFDMATMFAVFVILSIMGIGLHATLQAIRRRLLFWSPREDRTIGA
jgi:NitT/TauT family transport system permease protein